MTFEELWALGYRSLVPIIPPKAPISPRSSLYKRIGTRQDGRGKTPGIKGRDGNWFSFDWTNHQADEADLSRWQSMGAGAGIKTGLQPDGNYLVPIDADTLDEDCARIIRDLAREHFGIDLPVRVGNYPKALYVLKVRGPYRYARVEFGPRDAKGNCERVEALANGRQFVAHGIHPKTGQPYHWPKALCHYDDLPETTPEAMDAFLEALARALPQAEQKIVREGATTEINQDTLKGDLDKIREAVANIPNTSEHFPTRESYRDMGYAIKAALPEHPDEAFEIFADWCDRWADDTNDPDVYRADWSRMHGPFRRGASWLYEKAEELSAGQFTRAEVWFDPVDGSDTAVATIFDQIAKQDREAAVEDALRPLTAGRLVWGDLDDLPPRMWLYGHKLQRKYTAFLAAPGGVGKTAWAIALMLSLAADRKLLHDEPRAGRPLNVWMFNLEDDMVEMKRRLKAALQFYDLGPEVLEHIRLNSGRDRGIKIVKTGKDGEFIATPDYAAMIEIMKSERIDLLIVDPFLRSHGVPENDNEAQDEVMRLWAQIAEEANAAVLLVHHTKKGAVAGDLDSMRGGSTQGGGARSAFTLAPMSSEEAARVGVPEDQRRLYVRLDDAKNNMAPPAGAAEWLKLESVMLMNGDDVYSAGDSVQVASAWSLPDAWAGVGDHTAAIMRAIDEGLENGERYSARAQDKDRWIGDLIMEIFENTEDPKSPEQVKSIIAQWVKEGLIETREYRSEKQRKLRKGLYVTSASQGDIFG